jgi:threonine/homoserine/homoserine lactone efflux protein
VDLESLPLALGIALSPFPIIPAILLLFTPRPRVTSWSFLGGWVIGILAAVTLFALLAEVVEQRDSSPPWLSWARLAVGAALVVLGLSRWRGRGEHDELPGWMRSVESATPRMAFRLALLLSAANPKILLLAAAAGLSIGAAALSTGGSVASILVFTAIAASTVALPVVLFTVRGDRMLVPLGAVKDWLQRNNTAVMAVVITVIGLLLLSKGVGGLRG